jgi:hypothetical protein
MTITGGVSINGLLQGLPQGQQVIAQMTIPAASTPQPQFVVSVLTTATEITTSTSPNGLLIIPPATTTATALSICTSGGTAVGPPLSLTEPSLISLSGGTTATIYLIATTNTMTELQAIFF